MSSSPLPQHRIPLSVPHMSGKEMDYIREAFETNWLSTVGPHLAAFEKEFSEMFGCPSVALSSGTAAIHLGLRLLGVGEGDEVICPTLTFVASANPILYQGARPIFMDSDRSTWNLDPNLLAEFLRKRAEVNKLPRLICGSALLENRSVWYTSFASGQKLKFGTRCNDVPTRVFRDAHATPI